MFRIKQFDFKRNENCHESIKKAYCRIFQNIFKFALPVLPYRNPKIIGSVRGIPEVLEKEVITTY